MNPSNVMRTVQRNFNALGVVVSLACLAACHDDGADTQLSPNGDGTTCVESTQKAEACGLNNEGVQLYMCHDNVWQKEGACVDPDTCKDGDTRRKECGLNADATQNQLCENGVWINDGTCDDTAACRNGVEHLLTCGRNGNGVQKVRCDAGQWTNINTCDDDPKDVCVNGDTWAKLCGLNDRGQQPLVCENGAWVEDGACVSDDECTDDVEEEVTCGLHDRGTLTRVCLIGMWENRTTCSDPDACLLNDDSNLRCQGHAIEALTFRFHIDQFWPAQVLNSSAPPEFTHVKPENFRLTNAQGLPVVFGEVLESTSGPRIQSLTALYVQGEDGRKYEVLRGHYHYRVQDDDGSLLQEGWLRVIDDYDINKQFDVRGYAITTTLTSDGTPRDVELRDDEQQPFNEVYEFQDDMIARKGYILLSNILVQHHIPSSADGYVGDYRYVYSPDAFARSFTLADQIALTVDFEVPAGAKFSASTKEQVFGGLPHYFPFSPYDVEYDADASDENVDLYHVTVREKQPFHVVVSSPGNIKVTRGQKFNTQADVPETPIEIVLKPTTPSDYGRLEFIEGEMYTNADKDHEIRLFKESTGAQDFYLDRMRVWQMMPRVVGDFVYTMNYFVEPDFHWTLYGDDTVDITEIGSPGRERLLIEARNDGVSVLTLSYDPGYLYNIDKAIDGNSTIEESFFPGIEPQNLNTTIIQVGEQNIDRIDPNFEIDVTQTWYFIRSINGELKEEHAWVTFAPTADTELVACVHEPLWYTDWDDQDAWHCADTRDAQGAFTLPLYEGQNILRLQSENSTMFRVLMAKGLDVSTEDISDASNPHGLKVIFDGLRIPIQKLSGIYNPGFPNGIWLEFDVDGFDPFVAGLGRQYTFIIDANFIEIYPDAPGEVEIRNGRIHSNVLGSAVGAHRHLTPGGTMPNLNASGGRGWYSHIPDFTVNVP